jgi:hypothetical protein
MQDIQPFIAGSTGTRQQQVLLHMHCIVQQTDAGQQH